MITVLPEQRVALVLVTAVVGVAACWLTMTPFGLLAPVAALLAYPRRRWVALVNAALAITLAASILAAIFDGDMQDPALSWAAFSAVALCIGAIVTTLTSAASDARVAQAIPIIESMAVHAWSADPDGRFTYVSPNTLAYIGRPAAELGPLPESDEFGWRRVVHPDDYARVVEKWRRCLRTGERYDTEHRIRRWDGTYRWFRNSGLPTRDGQGRITGWYGTTMDIEEQRQAEAALRDRERELSQLVDMVPSHLWRLTPDGDPIFFNKRMVDFLGLDVADLDRPGVSRLEVVMGTIIHPDDAAELSDAFNRCLATGDRFSMRYRLRRADGIYRWMSSRAEPMRDQAGRTLQWYGLCHDIDDQVRAEEGLRRSERQLQQLIDAVPALIWRATPEGAPSYVNKRFIDVIGASLEDITAQDGSLSLTVVHPDDRGAAEQAIAHSFETGAPYLMRYRQLRRGGLYRWTETRAEPLRDDSGRILQWYGVSVDIDDLVTAQDALRLASDKLAQASQAASLAELSASIAHEVNQPLAAVVANSHACQRWLTAEPPNLERAQKTVERIVRDANSAADVVSRIRALFRQSTGTRICTTLPDVVAEARNLMAEEAVRRRIRMDIQVESGLPLVALDRVQVQQVLINLIRNGMDAMECVPSDRVLGIRVRRMGEMVQTEIHDRGRGIDFPDKIFEPFFTTKAHGMGMGLSICRSIVESHGGRLWAQNSEPQGAAFIFTLPVEVRAAS